ncbi:uncharacterized protein F4822DRAFT_440513 [Hypoxylon trugodes]|uniref:uncharacterized protein n=1 Tax=Hypoxylon trugodes TaxID=326681 RepID=UPI00219E926E|nr:uncharacterized protein F4822DRAFT_440513 [Hypoxylon trugodes]KAI1383414.1 hypothetical protein F4822DRAFT_440513 [Hypoxylon trugodes]
MSSILGSAYPRNEMIAAVHEFYAAIIKPPYIDPNALILPPAGGWLGVNEDELRKRGKTDEVIDLLRHLPYLVTGELETHGCCRPIPVRLRTAMVSCTIIGSMRYSPRRLIVYGLHMRWHRFAARYSHRYHHITEWAMLGQGCMIGYEKYEQLPVANKWMAFRTYPTPDLFRLWRAKWEKLLWLPIPSSSGGRRTTMCTGNEVESEDGEDEVALLDAEVDDILKDVFGKEAEDMRARFTAQQGPCPAELTPRPPPPDMRQEREKRCEQQAKEIYKIYKENGWLSQFDREKYLRSIARQCAHKESCLVAISALRCTIESIYDWSSTVSDLLSDSRDG